MGKQLVKPVSNYTSADIVPTDLKDTVDGMVIMHPKCKFCNSKHRAEAENTYEKTKKFLAAKRYLDDQGEKINIHRVTNHLRFHYESLKNMVALREGYGSEIARWMNHHASPEVRLKSRMAVLEREMHILASQSEGLPLEDRQRNTEQVRKLGESLLSYETRLSDTRKEGQPVKRIFTHLNAIMHEVIEENPDNTGLRNILVGILEKLHEKVGDLSVAGVI